jgi:hypothetical protein
MRDQKKIKIDEVPGERLAVRSSLARLPYPWREVLFRTSFDFIGKIVLTVVVAAIVLRYASQYDLGYAKGLIGFSFFIIPLFLGFYSSPLPQPLINREIALDAIQRVKNTPH